jgi:hypothetical protein
MNRTTKPELVTRPEIVVGIAKPAPPASETRDSRPHWRLLPVMAAVSAAMVSDAPLLRDLERQISVKDSEVICHDSHHS